MGDLTTLVGFTCQQCHHPIKLDISIRELDRDEFTSLTTATEKTEKKVFPTETFPPARILKTIDDLSGRQSAGVDLWKADGESLQPNQTATRLFDIMSEQFDFDHPLCEECTDSCVDQLDVQLREADERNRYFTEFLRTRSTNAGVELNSLEENELLKKEIEAMEREEKQLLAKLEVAEKERNQVKAETETAEAAEKEIDAKEEKYWKEYNEFQLNARNFHLQQSSVENRSQYMSSQLEKLKKTNVFNDAFHIWYDGHFGTINGFRLGKLPSVPVEWNEINAAWGMTVLLLYTMAKRLEFSFNGYNLVPNGSHSRLEKTNEMSKELPLYVPGGFKLFWESKFSSAMIAFLECLQQFKDHVESRDPHFKLPYKIQKDKIGDSHGLLSIKYQLNNEEIWTKASKFMLTNLKWCLAWVCKQTGAPAPAPPIPGKPM